jgi:hypothetical protein
VNSPRRRLDPFRHITVDNPLFHYRMYRASIYTWRNLAIGLIVLASLYCAVMRFRCYLEACRIANALPVSLQGQDYGEGTGWEPPGGLFDASTIEEVYSFGQFGGLASLYFLLVIGLLGSWHPDKDRWNHYTSLEIRLLPLSKSQVYFALVELRFYTLSLWILVCTMLLLLPGRAALEPKEFPAPYYMAWLSLLVWVLIFALYRTLQFRWRNFWRNPMLSAWGIVIVMLFPAIFAIFQLFATQPPSPFWQSVTADLEIFIVVCLITASIACAILLTRCWSCKARLLEERFAKE